MPGQVLGQGTVSADGEVLGQKLHSKNTAILADTLHFETLSIHDFDGTMLNLKRVLEALTSRQLDYYLWVATKKVFDLWSEEKSSQKSSSTPTRQEQVLRVTEHFLLELGMAIGDRVSGPHIAFIDPRGHDDTHALVDSGQRMFDLFRSHGAARQAIMVSIPATEAGIRAAQYLKKERKINVNLYLVTSVMHAAACVEASAAAISVPVGPLLQKYEIKRRTPSRLSSLHPGIEAIQSILAYFKHNEVSTRAIGTAFRNVAEIDLLSDFDAVCVSPAQADRLRNRVPITSLEGTDLSASFRGKQAKYPTDLLTKTGGFSTWFSPESRNLTTDLLRDALTEMQGHMEILEDFVEREVVQQFEIDTMDLRTLLLRSDDPESRTNGKKEHSFHFRTSNRIDTLTNETDSIVPKESSARSSPGIPAQDMDDIF